MKKTWRIICNIFKYSIRALNFIRTVTVNLISLILIITGLFTIITLYYSTPSLTHGALIMDLSGTITNKPATYNKLQKMNRHLLNVNKSYSQENSLFDIVNILRQAKNDPNITGLILSLKNFSGTDQTSLEYIGKILHEFRSSGKPIYSISDYYDQEKYFLASFSNKIYLTPQGAVNLCGFSTNKLYYKSLLDKLKITTHIFQAGIYKSAVEPFVRDNMSNIVKKEEKKWVNQLWKQYLDTISLNRQITNKNIFSDANQILTELREMQGDTAKYALKNKWIDEISSYLDTEDIMKKIFGTNKKNNSLNAISIYDYVVKTPEEQENQIAIICINGSIIDGFDISNSIGANSVICQIRQARLNPKVKAIILRINSPGGSVNAAELIRLELIATRNAGKPIIVSMGGMAASGGYWISTPANIIIASKSTLTGSIGVFGIINTIEKSLDSIGIHSDGVSTSSLANISITKELPNEYIDIMQLYVDTSYKYFLDTVKKFRSNTIKDITHIAEGRVWIGSEAIKHGLIDKIGDFDDAVKKASELANVKNYQLVWYKEKTNWIDLIIQKTSKITCLFFSKILEYYVPSIYIQIEKLKTNTNDLQFIWNDPKNCYALYLDFYPIKYI